MENEYIQGTGIMPGVAEGYYSNMGPTIAAKASTEALMEALSALTYAAGPELQEMPMWGKVSNIATAVSSISKIFEEVNQSVSTAWDNVLTFIVSIDKLVDDLLKNFVKELKEFISNMESYDAEVIKIANSASELASDILSTLKTSIYSFIPGEG